MIPKKVLPPARADDALRARGLRLTRPRRAILDAVRASDAHPSAAMVYRAVRRRLPRVSLATVYRNLRRLGAEGFLRERADPTGLRFDGNVEPHDHVTCLDCGRIFDVPPHPDRGERARVAAVMDFEVLHHRQEFYGRCGRCRRRRGAAGSGRRRHTTKEEVWQSEDSRAVRASRT